ncbi:MAG: hypothetical protein AABP62_02665 [Planctomycetota bacterium]
MFAGVLALLERSLRIDARSWQTHVTRLGLMVGIYVSLSFAFALASRFGAPGLRFFSANVYLNVIFLTLLGVGFFSTAITEEKEEDTLGLMLMAGISPLGLLIGKLGGRLFQALLLIIVQYPFTLLAITLGGVSSAQVQAAYVSLTCYMLLLAGGGLLCSTLAPRSRTAGTWMVVALFVYGLVPYFCQTLRNNIARFSSAPASWFETLLEAVASFSLFLRIGDIITTGFGESPWSWQAVSNLMLGVICFGLSWCCFGFATREPATEAAARGGLSRSQKGLARSFSPGRAWENPFVWKDFHFVAGGLSRRLLRILFYPALFGFSLGLSVLWSRSGDNVVEIYQFLVLLAVLWELSILAAQSIHDEVRGQTIASLVMLPHSVRYVFYSKLLGAVAGMYPGLVCFLVANVIGFKHVVDFFQVDGLAVLAILLLVPHFSAAYALFVRWGAVSLAIGSMIAVYFAIVALFQIIRPVPHEFVLHVFTFFLLSICAACHVVVLWRIPYVASR